MVKLPFEMGLGFIKTAARQVKEAAQSHTEHTQQGLGCGSRSSDFMCVGPCDTAVWNKEATAEKVL